MAFKLTKMKKYLLNKTVSRSALFLCVFCLSIQGYSQDTTATSTGAETTETTDEIVKPKIKPVKNTFGSIWIIDNQTVMVPVKKTFEMDIMHRFGTVGNGYEDFWGMFAPSNIRLGVSYAPID